MVLLLSYVVFLVVVFGDFTIEPLYEKYERDILGRLSALVHHGWYVKRAKIVIFSFIPKNYYNLQ